MKTVITEEVIARQPPEAQAIIVTCDRAKMYWQVGRLQWCWAHLKRDLQAMIDGLDLAPLLRGQTDAEFGRPLVWHFPNFWGSLSDPAPIPGPGMGPSSTLRRGDWKLIYCDADQRFELCDLAHDLEEKYDCASRQPQRVREMAAELTRVLRQHHAPMPIVKAAGKPVAWPIDALPPKELQ